MYRKTLLATAVLSTLAASSLAQAADDKKDDQVERIEVTGSHIRRADLEGPSPVLYIDANQIARSGARDLGELLKKLPVAGNGSFSPQGNDSDSTANGSAGISLRGLGADSTLVLLNGRRIAVNAFAQGIDTAFVDINAIPVAAIERIDVLKDGASAIYGSDAIAGVVNVILKKNFDGTEINASMGDTKDGGGAEKSASLLWGHGDDKAHTTVILDYFKRDETFYSDRSYSRNADQSSRGGTDHRSSSGNPGSYIPATVGADGSITPKSDLYEWQPDVNCPVEDRIGAYCRFNYAPWMTLNPSTERTGLILTHQQEITENITGFMEANVQHSTSNVHGAPSPSFGEFYMLADNPLFTSGAATNPFPGEDLTMRRRTTEAGARHKQVEADNQRLVLGLNGQQNAFDWELSYTYSRSRSHEYGKSGFVQSSRFQDAINAGLYNPFATEQDPAVIDDISVQTTRSGRSVTKAWDGQISGDAFALPGGDSQYAVGVEYRQEEIEDVPDELFLRGEVFGTEATTAFGSRNQYSVYGELALPIVEKLEAQLALRYEHYSDFGTNTSPKVALQYKVTEDLMLRGSWGKAFRAPSLVQLGLGPTQESPSLTDPLRCEKTGADEDCKGLERTVILSGNPDLKPEKSDSYNLGMVWQPLDALEVVMDYWNYDQKNLIDTDTQYRLTQMANGVAEDNFQVIREPAANGVPGRIFQIVDQYQNLGGQKTDGIDLDMRYHLDSNVGLFNLSYLLTWVNNFKEIKADGKERNLAGKWRHPEWRWNAALDWSLNDWAATARVNYIGQYEDNVDVGADGTVDRFVTLDTSVSYQGLEHWKLTLGANNLFNEKPPFSDNDFMGYDTETASAQGRFAYFRVNYRF
ncbi:TonB-dependent receptor [Gallaecimonas kandeliae]|uniref:TonB-dependent receptor n=1 Tax=Gallaecimonas kandeliae TaxID=3029055 RepID=UPI00264936DF|nr:TonB-dependent receptor [Gallaecimonas kandeliae]WKE66939.1 TonB-dependent receptor [Gallaecimonas kandeliae]